MMDEPLRAQMIGPGADGVVISEVTQTPVPSHVATVPGLGEVYFHHATAINVATLSLDDGDERIALQLATDPCRCGCGVRGRGLVITPDPEMARLIGQRLIAAADAMEAEALQQAASAIAKAAGK